MPRGLTKKYLSHKEKELAAQPENLGLTLGDLSHKTGVPPVVMAEAMQVAVSSVYRWMRGAVPRDIYAKNITQLIRILKYGLEHGYLPHGKSSTPRAALSTAATAFHDTKRS